MATMRKLLHEELMRARLAPENALTAARRPFHAMLDNIRSAYNVGSIFRTCDAALAGGLILSGYTPAPPNKEIEKTALGASATVPWRHFSNQIEAADYLKDSGVRIIAVELTDSSRPYTSLSASDFPCCFAFGNEVSGISPDILRRACDAVEIPMYGVKHSLNVAVAAGIILFEASRVLLSSPSSRAGE